MKGVATVFLATMISSSALAQSPTPGMFLFNQCLGPNKSNLTELECQIYFVGFFEGFMTAVGLPANPICVPPNATANQVKLITEKYMQDHPEQLNHPAGAIILDAMFAAFPCKRSN